MGNIGYCTRGTRMLQIVKGSDLVSGVKQTAAYKVEDGKFRCLSGEPIYAKKENGEIVWVKEATKTTSAPFFAFTDSDSFDVIASGSLLGISVLDTFELQTPLFMGTTFNPGEALTIGTGYIVKNAEGDFVVAEEDDAKGRNIKVNCVVKAEDGDAIIGYVTEGIVQLKGDANVSVVNDTESAMKSLYLDGYQDSKKLSSVITGGPSLYTEASKSKFVLQFATAWKPAVKTKETDPEVDNL